MTEKKRVGRWKAGESGNPKGKTPGSGELQKLRASLTADLPGILAGLVLAAKAGDVQAARLILERILPPMRPIEQPQALTLPANGSLTAQGRAVLSAVAAVAAGQLAPSQGAALLSAIGTLARVQEVDELAARIEKLEQRHATD